MKKILITESEKNRILEYYDNSLLVDISNFKKLSESKLGDVKPLINEEKVPFTNATEGNKFRKWVNKYYPELAKKYDLWSEADYYDNINMNNTWNHSFGGNDTLGSRYKYVLEKGYDKAMNFNSFFMPELQSNNKSSTTNVSGVPFTNNEEGNEFRKWVNTNYKSIATGLDLSEVGNQPDSYKNDYIKKAWNYKVGNFTLGQLYDMDIFKWASSFGSGSKKETTSNDSKKETSKVIVPDLNSLNVSNQVKKQIAYLTKIEYNKKYTILDDINNMLYCVDHFTLKSPRIVYSCPVITGLNSGDKTVMKDFSSWLYEKWKKGEYRGKTWAETQQLYLNTTVGIYKQTPTGIFRRWSGFLGLGVAPYIYSLAMTIFFNKTYGRLYITFVDNKTGEIIPFGFHGTRDDKRINIEKDEFIQSNRNMSFGCINFTDKDIIEVNRFIDGDQVSFWLPDDPSKICEFDNMSMKYLEAEKDVDMKNTVMTMWDK